jgi:hypothetical protein
MKENNEIPGSVGQKPVPKVKAEMFYGRINYTASLPGVGEVVIFSPFHLPQAIDELSHLNNGKDIDITTNELRSMIESARSVRAENPESFMAWLEQEGISWDKDSSDVEKGSFSFETAWREGFKRAHGQS